jgi:DNA polymerase (family 10)
MPVYNSEIAKKFQKIADLLEIKGDNPFRIRAYRRGARKISSLSQNLEDMIKAGEDLTKLSAIGEDLSNKIKEFINTGKILKLKTLEKEIPAELVTLLDVEGLGPKRVKILYRKLKIDSIADLKKAIKKEQIRNLEGFGKKTEKNIAEALKEFKTKKRILLSSAEEIIQPLIQYLQKDSNIQQLEVTGSYRRKKETIGDFDLLVSGVKGKEIIDRFVNYENTEKIISQGETRSTIKLKNNIQVDLRVVPKESYGAALLYFTGSREHNITLRNLAIKKGFKLNEYGLFDKKTKEKIAGETEKEIYKKLDLDFIPPELREDRGEIYTAQQKELPKLLELSDIKGDLHIHTINSDGDNSIEEMVQEAIKLKRRYIAITDHSGLIPITNGLKKRDVDEYIEKIKRVDQQYKEIKVFTGCEVDIKKDGSLFFKDKILKKFDIVICAIHSHFNLDFREQTERIIKAISSPYIQILAHPTGRRINHRKGYQIDMEKIMKTAKEKGCLLEINSQPSRLDLDDRFIEMAKDLEVKMIINTDAHNIKSLKNIKYGTNQARRGWLEKKNIINTLNLKEFKKLLKIK